MSRPVRARRLTQDEGSYLLRLVRRGRADTVRYRRALIILSSSGTLAPVIARLVAADPDTVRDVIHAFNAQGLAALQPHWGGGRPRRISDEDIDVVVQIALTRPKRLGLPFTHWSIRKLAAYLSGRYGRTDPAQMPTRIVRIGRERVRRILHEHEISFQRTRTWKTSTDPDYDAKLDRIEEVMTRFPDRVFAFDQFGPLSIRPCHGTCWAAKKHPDRLRATYKRTHGIRYFHGCYDLANDRLWGVLHEHKGGVHTLAALKSIRATRPDGAPIYVIEDNLSCNKTPAIRAWAKAHKVELCLTPTNASWADPIEAQSGPLRQFSMADSDHPNHVALAHDLHAYLRWRNINNRHPAVLAAQRRERVRLRGERHQRWGRPRPHVAAVPSRLTNSVIIRGHRPSPRTRATRAHHEISWMLPPSWYCCTSVSTSSTASRSGAGRRTRPRRAAAHPAVSPDPGGRAVRDRCLEVLEPFPGPDRAAVRGHRRTGPSVSSGT